MKTIYYSLFVFLLSSATIWGQCPSTISINTNSKCIYITWSPLGSYPSSITVTPDGGSATTYNNPSVVGNTVTYEVQGISGNCSGSSPIPFSGTLSFSLAGQDFICPFINGTLPLADTKFTAVKNSSAVNITWEANDNEECLGYELEYSIDGSVWKALIWKSNTQPRVTTTYIATDNSTYTGVIYYRLKRVLADGNSDYSKVISVGNNAAVVVAPNPASDVVTLLPGKEVDIEMLSIFDAKGNLIQKLSHPSKTLSIEELIPGLYFFQLETIESSYTQKIYIQE